MVLDGLRSGPQHHALPPVLVRDRAVKGLQQHFNILFEKLQNIFSGDQKNL